MNILVVGSNSFTGSHMINYLLNVTDFNVYAFSRSNEYDSLFLAYRHQKKVNLKRFHFFQADINKDLEFIWNRIEEIKPRIIFYYAAQGEVRNSWKWPEDWWLTNALGIVRFTNFLKNCDFLQKFIMCSTPEVYGNTKRKIKESFSFDPSTPYGASKLAGDLHLRCFFKNYGFPVIFTRSSNVYGKHQQLYRIIPKTIISLLKGIKITLHNNGNTTRSFVHISDVCKATLQIIEKGKIGEVYHIDNYLDKPIKIKELVRKICNILEKDFEKCVEYSNENFGQDQSYKLDCQKIQNEIGWSPKISLLEGINEVVNWINFNWENIKDLSTEYVHKK
ncbi:MAG: GDP-mannose 4,6-dehydratase [Chthoniobacterales bacterium]|nr:GDP-mannose 4,6-dehydratase [Chthoniobacterales bacterium]